MDEAETWSLDRRVRVVVDVQREAGDDLDVRFFPGRFLKDAPAGSFTEFVPRGGIEIVGSQEPGSATRARSVPVGLRAAAKRVPR